MNRSKQINGLSSIISRQLFAFLIKISLWRCRIAFRRRKRWNDLRCMLFVRGNSRVSITLSIAGSVCTLNGIFPNADTLTHSIKHEILFVIQIWRLQHVPSIQRCTISCDNMWTVDTLASLAFCAFFPRNQWNASCELQSQNNCWSVICSLFSTDFYQIPNKPYFKTKAQLFDYSTDFTPTFMRLNYYISK